MPTIILSMDVSGGARRIRRAISDVGGVDSVEVYSDTGRVVVTGWADTAELVTRLESRLGVNVDVVNDQDPPNLEFSSDEDDDDEDDSSSDDDDDYSGVGQPANPLEWWPYNPTGEMYGMGLPAPRVREPSFSDQPLPDPSSWFYNFTLTEHHPPPPQDEEDDDD